MGLMTATSWLRRLIVVALLGAVAMGGLPHRASAAPGAARSWPGAGAAVQPAFNPQPDPPAAGHGRSIARPFGTQGGMAPADLPAGLAPALASTPDLAAQQAELTPADGQAGDEFGWTVDVSGDTAVVGAYHSHDYAGAAYIFVRTGTVWTLQQELADPAPVVTYDDFGTSVAIDGDTVVVGAWGKNSGAGAAYVYVRSGTTWAQQATLSAPDGAPNDIFGWWVALRQSTILVGAQWHNSQTGAAYVFVRARASWGLQAELVAADGAPGDDFGQAVALGTDTAVIGADGKNNGAGAVYVFHRDGSAWTQQAELVAADAAPGDSLGITVAVSQGTIVAGAAYRAGLSGAAYVFINGGMGWVQQAEITAADGAPLDELGDAVAVRGNVALVAAPYHNGGRGTVYVYTRSGTTWTLRQELVAADAAPGDHFGFATALRGTTALFGAQGKNAAMGSAYVFTASSAAAADDGDA